MRRIPSKYRVHIWCGKTRMAAEGRMTQSFGHNTSTWQTHRQTHSHVAIANDALTHSSGGESILMCYCNAFVANIIVMVLFVLQHECWITQYLPRRTVHIIKHKSSYEHNIRIFIFYTNEQFQKMRMSNVLLKNLPFDNLNICWFSVAIFG